MWRILDIIYINNNQINISSQFTYFYKMEQEDKNSKEHFIISNTFIIEDNVITIKKNKNNINFKKASVLFSIYITNDNWNIINNNKNHKDNLFIIDRDFNNITLKSNFFTKKRNY